MHILLTLLLIYTLTLPNGNAANITRPSQQFQLGYRFQTHPVDVCPRNEEDFNRAAKNLNCTGKSRYLCAPNKKLTNLIEFCTDRPPSLYGPDKCVLLEGTGDLNHYDCVDSFISGCPNTAYTDKEIYKFPACLEINRAFQCFDADKSCKKRIQIFSDESPLDNNSNNTWIFIIYFVFLSNSFVIGILLLIISKRRKKKGDIENQTGSTVVCAELTDSEIQPDRTTFANDLDPNLPKIIVDPENSTEIEKETTKENREQKQQNPSSDVIENQTGSTVICDELTDPEIQPDHTTFSNDADPSLPKIIVDPEYTNEFEKETTKENERENNASGPSQSQKELRIVLLGKKYAGKSATGNSILNGKLFESTIFHTSVRDISTSRIAYRFGRRIQIVETPGVFDISTPNDVVQKEIVKCIAMTVPGPHCFILVMGASSRFTQEDKISVDNFVKYFGDNVYKHLIILFTRKDDLDDYEITLEDYIQGSPKDLKTFIAKCNNRVIAFNNKAASLEKEKHVKDLLKLIDDMVCQNKGEFFTNDMYHAAEEMIRRRQDQIDKEREEKHEEEIKAVKRMLAEEVSSNWKKQNDLEEEIKITCEIV